MELIVLKDSASSKKSNMIVPMAWYLRGVPDTSSIDACNGQIYSPGYLVILVVL